MFAKWLQGVFLASLMYLFLPKLMNHFARLKQLDVHFEARPSPNEYWLMIQENQYLVGALGWALGAQQLLLLHASSLSYLAELRVWPIPRAPSKLEGVSAYIDAVLAERIAHKLLNWNHMLSKVVNWIWSTVPICGEPSEAWADERMSRLCREQYYTCTMWWRSAIYVQSNLPDANVHWSGISPSLSGDSLYKGNELWVHSHSGRKLTLLLVAVLLKEINLLEEIRVVCTQF